jgi:hypothetical protein
MLDDEVEVDLNEAVELLVVMVVTEVEDDEDIGLTEGQPQNTELDDEVEVGVMVVVYIVGVLVVNEYL